jgi:hypothetical protein
MGDSWEDPEHVCLPTTTFYRAQIVEGVNRDEARKEIDIDYGSGEHLVELVDMPAIRKDPVSTDQCPFTLLETLKTGQGAWMELLGNFLTRGLNLGRSFTQDAASTVSDS